MTEKKESLTQKEMARRGGLAGAERLTETERHKIAAFAGRVSAMKRKLRKDKEKKNEN